VKLAAARNANVTEFTTSPGKLTDAKRLGAHEAVLWSDTAAMKQLVNRFDLLISTVPVAYSIQPFMNLLRLDATLVGSWTFRLPSCRWRCALACEAGQRSSNCAELSKSS
jgi:D-arabinose 1-dehydrogenase-like Zn-dependent alcohol dehydrogenase